MTLEGTGGEGDGAGTGWVLKAGTADCCVSFEGDHSHDFSLDVRGDM